mmetsp:Transcript_15259/g.26434  ORF Transcript_15259/g.26434 Transcript_15259/m.26434 type:complete len:316 (-) Transcript_15259:473-1420(-)|eukprot:CAMPEP_0119101122 /NCGR_PEP_ID=MMETSP1180-20130426/256_1 /TAXON_ID=3052 ORGANISM="Chlamydomonas cf sp, Strain CCMP681" /NCGR_SAMPLE_ID=MMETSP1180 /ASSEMBLY_ACC=CAM_ASM_000741 /LENGTH=315 /DNA_ID=CAMNT_0007085181 /DNA_START=81 /DNA_END=1028 /DNA_ORIENTATION=+
MAEAPKPVTVPRTRRKVMLAIDESEHSRAAVDAAFVTNCCRPSDRVHLVAVAHSISDPHLWKAIVTPEEEEKLQKLLRQAAQMLTTSHGVLARRIHTHVLTSEGGASGASRALLELAKKEDMNMIVAGSRGFGSLKSSLMSLVGLGSVGDELISRAHCPVVLVRADATHKSAATAQDSKKVCVVYDGSRVSDYALEWALKSVMRPQDTLNISVSDASVNAEKALAIAETYNVPKANVSSAVLMKKSQSVGKDLTQYVHGAAMDVVVVGNKDMGSVQRVFDGMFGHENVSMHLAHTLHGVLIVVREPPPPAAFAHH